MALFKEVKKPVIKAAAPSGAEISPLRPGVRGQDAAVRRRTVPAARISAAG